MTEPTSGSDRLEVILEIVKADYDNVTSALNRLEANRDALRGIALTLTIAAMGFAIANRFWFAPLAGAFILILLAWGDLRLRYQHQVAVRRSQALEFLVQRYVSHRVEEGRPMSERASRKLEDAVSSYRFGSNLNLRRPSVKRVYQEVFQDLDWSTYLYTLQAVVLIIVTLWLTVRP